MLTKTNTIYGQATYGGKIHRTTADGHAWCLSGNGNKPMRNVVVEVPADATRQEETDALRAAGVKPEALCSKCCSTSKNLLEAASASDRTIDYGIEKVETDAGTLCIHDTRDLNAKFSFAGLNADQQWKYMRDHFFGYLRHRHDDGDLDFVVFLPSGDTLNLSYDASQHKSYGVTGTNLHIDDLFAYANAVRAIATYIEEAGA